MIAAAMIGAVVLGVVSALGSTDPAGGRAPEPVRVASAEARRAPPEGSASTPKPLFEARATYTREFGLPRPSAVAFDPEEGLLLLAGSGGGGTRLLRLDPASEEPRPPLVLLPGDPSTMAFDAASGRLTLIDGSDLVVVPRDRLSQRRPTVDRIPLAGVGLGDPAGATFDGSGDLLVLDAATLSVVRIAQGDPARAVGRIDLGGVGRGLRGLAFNPADGSLYTSSADEQLLYSIDLDGSVRSRYELGSLEVAGLEGIAFGPTADPTDDPAETSLYVADGGDAELFGGVMEVRLQVTTTVAASIVDATLVQSIDTSGFSPASPDPSGITYVPALDRLLIVDSEVDETTGAGYHGANMWWFTRTGSVSDTGTTLAYSSEPTGVSYAPSIDTLFISADLSCCNGIYIVKRGLDGDFGTSDDQVSFFNAAVHGVGDTEDPEYDPATGHLFFLWGTGAEVFRVNPVNGTFGDADDIVTHFDVGRYGAADTEALALDLAHNTLLVGERTQDTIYEVTKNGDLIRTIDTSGVSGLSRISGMGMAPASDNSGGMNIWIADRASDNDSNPNENDGKVFELSVPTAGNTPPIIDSVSITPSAPYTNDVLTAAVSATDADGDPITYTYQWFRNGTQLPGRTGTSLDLSAPGNGDRDDEVSVRVVAFDGSDSSTPRDTSVIVQNSLPVFGQDLLDRTDSEGAVVSMAAGATDADGDALTYSATGLPQGVSVDPATGSISGTIAAGAAAGSPYATSVSVRDGDPPPPSSGIALVQSQANDASSVTSFSLTYAQPPTQGNLLVGIAHYGSNRVPTIPSGWSLAIDTNSDPETVVFYKVAGAGEPSNVPFSLSGAATRISLAIFEYEGLLANQGTVLDRVVSNTTAAATSVSTGTTQTTTQGSELLLASVGVSGNRTFMNAWTNGFQRQTEVKRHTVAHRIVSATGQYQTSESWDTASGPTGVLVTFKAGAGGPVEDVTDDFTWTVSGPGPPSPPALVAPSNGATGVGTSPTLDVIASDGDGGDLTVAFYGRPLASGTFRLIGTDLVTSGQHATTTWSSIGAGQTFQWYATVSDESSTTQGSTWTFHTAPGPDPVFVGSGDIASCSSLGDEQTAAVVAGVDGLVFTTGDNAYDDGTFTQFMNCYDPSWGAFKARTRPIPGNRDWGVGVTNSLAGYFQYFGASATDANGKSYYSYDIDANWHVVNLDSECALVAGGCGLGSPQAQWLAADLAANADKNVIAVWHRPLFSSGGTDESAMEPMGQMLYDAGVDIALVGHDHLYERFAPMDPNGQPDPAHGIRHFVVGSGGRSHHPAGPPLPTSEALNDTEYGVLKLTLHATSYDWQFLTVAGGTFTDSGTGSVHDAPGGNQEPVFNQDLPNRTDAEGAVISLSAGATDPDGDPLTYGATGLPPGLSINTSTGLISGTIAFDAAAGSPYSVQVTVRDGPAVDATDTFTWTVTNTNREPTFNQDLPDRTDPEGAVISLSAGATDPDGDALTYAATGLPNGLSINASTGLISGTIAFDAAAGSPYSVQVTVRDGPTVDATDTFTWTVTNSNRSPILAAIGDQSVAEGAVQNVPLSAFDADGDPLAFSLDPAAPAWVTLTDAGDGTATLTLSPGFADAGAHPVTVTVTDGSLSDAETITVTVTNTNREPTFNQDLPDRTDPEGAVISLSAGATDPDGDPLTYAATGLPPGLSINTTTGLISGTIAFDAAASSPYSVQVTVRDGPTVDATDTFTWTVTNTNREPTFNQDLGDRTSAEGAVISLSAGATDPDGDPLTYAATGLPPGLSIDASTGLISGTIDAGAAAGSPYSVQVTVRDGPAVDATDTFTWTVTAVPPANTPPVVDSVTIDQPAPRTNATLTVTVAAHDDDGDPITYTYQWTRNGTDLPGETRPTLDLSISGNGDKGDQIAVRVTASDGQAASAPVTSAPVTVANADPVFNQDLPDRTDPEGAVISLSAGATDPDGDALTYAATGLPNGLSINASTGLISGTIAFDAAASSPYSVQVTVSDPTAGSAIDTFTWTVQDTPAPPAPTGLTATASTVGIHLRWDAGQGTLTYNVYRSSSVTGPFTLLNAAPLSATQYDDTTAPVNATSFYRVTAVGAGQNESMPAETSARRGIIAFRGATSGSVNRGDTVTLPPPTGVASGDTMLAGVLVAQGSTVTPPTGWTSVANVVTGGNQVRLAVYVRVAGANEPSSYQWKFSNRQSAVVEILAYRGVSTASPIETSATQTSPSSSSIGAPSVTTTVNEGVLVAFFGIDASVTIDLPSRMIEQVEAQASGKEKVAAAAGDEVIPSAGATGDRVATAGASAANAGASIVLRPGS